MNWLVYHIASGHAFFTGVALFIIAALVSIRVSLVPKRVLLSILAAKDSTLDTIHLTQAGHHRMAACVWQLVSLAFPTKHAAQ